MKESSLVLSVFRRVALRDSQSRCFPLGDTTRGAAGGRNHFPFALFFALRGDRIAIFTGNGATLFFEPIA
jgi:hypothetical protein